MIARVTLDLAVGKAFDYLVPEALIEQVHLGSRVKVPFGHREVLGSVTEIGPSSSHPNLKPIARVIGGVALLTPPVLELARWIAAYYCCPLEVVLRSVLPEAVRKEDADWRQQLEVRVAPPVGERPALTPRQQEVWHVVEEWRALPLQKLLALTGATAATVRKLEDKGWISIAPAVSERDPYAHETIVASTPLALYPEQAAAFAAIRAAVLAPAPAGRTEGSGKSAATEAPTFLVHGVTGSGKTEIYLQAIAETLRLGKGAIVLVPEISLTPQTVERFKSRFTGGPERTLVAVLHSHLSAGERHDEWHKIRQGRARIVIGARSAVFAPVQPLGLIIVDEEHENSYKQEEAPRYHARDVAVKRGRLERAVVVLGSATPSLESYENAQKGKYRLLQVMSRVDDKKLPIVRVVDMRSEASKGKGLAVFAEPLRRAIAARLDRKEQVMLFLNRRGYATSMQCPACGIIRGCPHCSVSLTYHRQEDILSCHICGYRERAPRVCPEKGCGSPAIRYAGLGTERVEETLLKLFPQAAIRRMDADALRRKDDFRKILGDFRRGKIDILVGTQMIAKGLHFPNVTLVGIIYADLALHLPDFRAGERTFQLLTQVAGRSGRGDVEGEVVVQAFAPFHPAIQHARKHDFIGFYEQEIEYRRQLMYPPFSRVALLTVRSRSEEKARYSAEHLRRELERALAGVPQLIIAGPGPAPLLKAENYYRYQLMLRTPRMMALSRALEPALRALPIPDDVIRTVDIDPVNLL